MPFTPGIQTIDQRPSMDETSLNWYSLAVIWLIFLLSVGQDSLVYGVGEGEETLPESVLHSLQASVTQNHILGEDPMWHHPLSFDDFGERHRFLSKDGSWGQEELPGFAWVPDAPQAQMGQSSDAPETKIKRRRNLAWDEEQIEAIREYLRTHACTMSVQVRHAFADQFGRTYNSIELKTREIKKTLCHFKNGKWIIEGDALLSPVSSSGLINPNSGDLDAPPLPRKKVRLYFPDSEGEESDATISEGEKDSGSQTNESSSSADQKRAPSRSKKLFNNEKMKALSEFIMDKKCALDRKDRDLASLSRSLDLTVDQVYKKILKLRLFLCDRVGHHEWRVKVLGPLQDANARASMPWTNHENEDIIRFLARLNCRFGPEDKIFLASKFNRSVSSIETKLIAMRKRYCDLNSYEWSFRSEVSLPLSQPTVDIELGIESSVSPQTGYTMGSRPFTPVEVGEIRTFLSERPGTLRSEDVAALSVKLNRSYFSVRHKLDKIRRGEGRVNRAILESEGYAPVQFMSNDEEATPGEEEATVDIKRGRWTPEEIQILEQFIIDHQCSFSPVDKMNLSKSMSRPYNLVRTRLVKLQARFCVAGNDGRLSLREVPLEHNQLY